MRLHSTVTVFALAVFLAGSGLALRAIAAPPATFRVAGAVEAPGEWSVERIEKELPTEIRVLPYKLKGEDHTARCIPLMTLLRAAKPRVEPTRKNALLAFTVTAKARDGYAVSFSLGELLPEGGNREVWLALDADGKDLSEEAAPVRLLVPGDTKPARWLFGIASLTLVNGAEAAKG